MDANTVQLIRNALADVQEVQRYLKEQRGEARQMRGETRAFECDLSLHFDRLNNARTFLKAALQDRDA